ncbi:hypothetical protein [Rickettsia endosymbiont of Cantharis rufa]|uniref:hypothetical protein n=1 Tax=Rickettsia endosymbiont of Cantharis rufa TaxID=3066248 RepID=UPI003132D93F
MLSCNTGGAAEVFYNRIRMHSANDYLSPVRYKKYKIALKQLSGKMLTDHLNVLQLYSDIILLIENSLPPLSLVYIYFWIIHKNKGGGNIFRYNSIINC